VERANGQLYHKSQAICGIANRYGGVSTYYKPDEMAKYWVEQIVKYAPKKEGKRL
jgi:hypothetical protein